MAALAVMRSVSMEDFNSSEKLKTDAIDIEISF
jgi:hypothetical protein